MKVSENKVQEFLTALLENKEVLNDILPSELTNIIWTESLSIFVSYLSKPVSGFCVSLLMK